MRRVQQEGATRDKLEALFSAMGARVSAASAASGGGGGGGDDDDEERAVTPREFERYMLKVFNRARARELPRLASPASSRSLVGTPPHTA